MNVLERVQKLLRIGSQKKIQIGLKEIENAYQNTETREEAIKEASRRAIEEINSNPEMALKVLKLMEESEELPKKVIVETIKKIPKTEQIENPGQTVIKAVENSDLLNSGDIKEIIKEADISIPTAKEVADQIPNDEIRRAEKERLEKVEKERKIQAKKEQEQKINQELKNMYVNCSGIKDTNILERLKKIRLENKSQKVKEMVMRVLARKTAIEFKQVGNARLYEMYKIITAEDMLESKFPDLVEEEYEEIKDVEAYKGIDGKPHEYKKDRLIQGILGEIAKNIVKTYNEVGVIDVPQSEVMKHLTTEEEEYLVGQIEIYCQDDIDIRKVKNQIRGIVDYQLKDLEEMIKKVPKDEIGDYVKSFKQQIARGKSKRNNIELSIELEEGIEELKQNLAELDEQSALEIIDEAKDNIKDKINEKGNKKEVQIEQNNTSRTTQADDDDEHIH